MKNLLKNNGLKVEWHKVIFIASSLIMIILAVVLFGCNATKELPVSTNTEITSDCDCEKSNSHIRQENRTERKRLEQETKRIKDSLIHDLKLAKINNDKLELINQQLKDSLRFGFKNNRIDSKENVKIEKSNDKVEKKEINKEKAIGKKVEKTKQKELDCWNWRDKLGFGALIAIIFLIIGIIVGILINSRIGKLKEKIKDIVS